MSKADDIFIAMCSDIIEHGTTTEGQRVRPRWEDGTPAYTIKRFGVCNRYDLREEFPALTLRRTALKSAMDEVLWIYQRKSNNIHDLNSHIWDEWADETGSIGKAYGYQVGVKSHYPDGDFDQMDRVLKDLRENPYSRRIMTNLYTFADLSGNWQASVPAMLRRLGELEPEQRGHITRALGLLAQAFMPDIELPQLPGFELPQFPDLAELLPGKMGVDGASGTEEG